MSIIKQARYLVMSCVLVCSFEAHANKVAEDIFGDWTRTSRDEENGIPFSVLILKLQKKGSRVTGTSCYIANFGRRIDCPTDGFKNVSGFVGADGKHAKLRIRSTYFSGMSKVSVSIAGDVMNYAREVAADDPLYFGPDKVILKRDTH
jgi:hypothetical protein